MGWEQVSGDVDFINHGGGVFDAESGLVEIVEPHDWEEGDIVENFSVHQFGLERFTLEGLRVEWFYDTVLEMADQCDIPLSEIEAAFVLGSTDVQNASAWCWLADFVGKGELDPCYQVLKRHEVHERYGEECDCKECCPSLYCDGDCRNCANMVCDDRDGV